MSVRRLPDFFRRWRQDWPQPVQWAPENYLDSDDALKVVIMSQWLFLPEFVELKGGIYRTQGNLESSTDHWLSVPGLRTSDVEARLNTVQLWRVFDHCDLNGLDENLDDLAESIALCWRSALAVQFPDRRFVIATENTEEGGYGPSVTFYSQQDEEGDHPVV